jgi:hypothetical protein
MGETGRLHDLGNADAVEALRAKKLARDLQYPFAVFSEFLAAHSHSYFSKLMLDNLYDSHHQ